jgi:hypothetical protein
VRRMTSVSAPRVLIDDSTRCSDSRTTNCFEFGSAWNLEENREGTESFNATVTETLITSIDIPVPHEKIAILHFSGVGVTLLGDFICLDSGATATPSTSERCYYSISLDNAPPIKSSVLPNLPGGRWQYNVTNLSKVQHTLALSDISTTAVRQTFQFAADYAYVELSQETQIVPGVDVLMINYTDPSILYGGRWTQTINDNGQNIFRSMDVGSSVSLTFFGKSILGWGYASERSGAVNLSISIDNAAPVLRSYENPGMTTFLSFYESNDIGGLNDSEVRMHQPHTIVIAITALITNSSLDLAVFGYSPWFTSLEEGEKLQNGGKPSGNAISPGSPLQASHRDPDHNDGTRIHTGPTIVGITLGALSLVVVTVCVSAWLYRKRKHRNRHVESQNNTQVDIRDMTSRSQGFFRRRIVPEELPVCNPKLYQESDSDTHLLANGGYSEGGSIVPYTKCYQQPDSTMPTIREGCQGSHTLTSPILGLNSTPPAETTAVREPNLLRHDEIRSSSEDHGITTAGGDIDTGRPTDPSQAGLDQSQVRMIELIEAIAARIDVIDRPPSYS